MKRARYIGDAPNLIGETALIQFISPTQAKIQVDDVEHRMAFGWWDVDPNEWKVDEI